MMFAFLFYRSLLSVNKRRVASILIIGRKSFSRSSLNSKGGMCPNQIKGIEHLRNPHLNKGLGFTLEERQILGINGLLAPVQRTLEQQVALCTEICHSHKNDIDKYLYLMELQERNECLFFNLLDQDIERYMPLIYTPTVGLACQKYNTTYRRPRGLYVTIGDKGHVAKVIANWPVPNVRAVVITDGERILGLGDLGAYGMGISVGKLALYTALASIEPHTCLPMVIDVGTDNEKLRNDPNYIGLRIPRVRGKDYDELVDEIMYAIIHRYGRHTLVQFEDFALANAGRLLQKYKDKFCTFNDDIQGTAAVSVAGIFASVRITKKKLQDYRFLFFGAGSAGTGIADLICLAMTESGMKLEDARAKIFMYDIDGVLTTQRKSGVPAHATRFAKDVPPETNFENAVKSIKPNCIIGVSTVGGAFTPGVLKAMAEVTERPVIFALSNPTSKAECTPQQAYDNTGGRCIYASGSPFPPVKYNGKEYNTGQGNNSYIFPGVALGVLTIYAKHIPDSFFLTAAQSLANYVAESDLSQGRIYPPIGDLKKISFQIAVEVVEEAYKKDLASVYPKPKDIKKYIKDHLFVPEYQKVVPDIYKYPDEYKYTMDNFPKPAS